MKSNLIGSQHKQEAYFALTLKKKMQIKGGNNSPVVLAQPQN